MRKRIGSAWVIVLLAACASQTPAPSPKPQQAADTPASSGTNKAASNTGVPTVTGSSYADAVQLAGASNPLVFSQKQQEWLWRHYRDWKVQSQALREQDGVQYDEVTLVNKRGESRVVYFRMPGVGKR